MGIKYNCDIWARYINNNNMTLEEATKFIRTSHVLKNLDDPKSTGENLRKISLAGNHLLTLINDILDISKVESGKLKLSPLTFSIVETVENLVNISQA